MSEPEKHGMFDSLLSRGEDALDKFMDDPQKVAKAKQKAEDALGKHMDAQQADSVTNAAEAALRKLADRNDPA